ncbi:MAG: lipid asymmetry maintenance protein MlaB [bacterium]
MAVDLSPDFQLSGDEVDLNDAERLKVLGLEIINTQNGPFTVGCAGLAQANSIVVALMICWHRHATLASKQIEFSHLSKDLQNIIAFSGLTRVLKIS